MKWIKANERLPRMETAVFMRSNGVMSMGNFYEQDGCYMLFVQRNSAHEEYELPWSSPLNTIEWLDEIEELWVEKIIEKLRLMNPYPIRTFAEVSEEEFSKISAVLTANGFSSDRIFGAWGRKVWSNCVKELTELVLNAEYEREVKGSDTTKSNQGTER
jgi:hypothetical protein